MTVQYITNGNTDGAIIGQTSASKVGFYGTTPIVRRTSTVLATSLLSASSYTSVGSNTSAIVLEIANALIALGLLQTA